MSTTYVDGSTPLDAAHMNALQQKVEKGITNGYASLDSGGKVPVAQLPANTPASPVVNGQWVKGVGGAAVWAAITPQDVANIPYGSSLPASPYDGQEAVLVDSVTNPTYQWRFRYNAGSTSAYKWEFVGGTDVVAGGGAFASNAASAWQGGPTIFTLPRAGDYKLFVQSRATNSSGVAAQANLGYWLAGANQGGLATFNPVPAGTVLTISSIVQAFSGLAAGTTVAAAYFVGSVAAGSFTWDQTSLTVTPRRVS